MTISREKRLLLERNLLEAFASHPGANLSLEELATTWFCAWDREDLRDSLNALVVCGVLAKYGPAHNQTYYAPESRMVQAALNLFTNWVAALD